MLTIEPTATAFWARRLGKGVGQHLLMSDRFRGNKLPSDELSDNRHGQRRTPADTHRRTTAGHACRAALTVRVGTWLRDEEANASTPKDGNHTVHLSSCQGQADRQHQQSASTRPDLRPTFLVRIEGISRWTGLNLAIQHRARQANDAHQWVSSHQVTRYVPRSARPPTHSTDQMVGSTGPTTTFTRAVPGPAHHVSNVMSGSGMCGRRGYRARLARRLTGTDTNGVRWLRPEAGT
jgi:hypothetical protein